MKTERLDYAASDVTSVRRRSAGQWVVLLLVWAVGLIVWMVYGAILFLLLLHVV